MTTNAAFSDGTTLSAENFLNRNLNRLARLQRQMARKHGPRDRNNPKTKQAPSNRWKKQRARIARFHGRIADTRRDFLHKAITMERITGMEKRLCELEKTDVGGGKTG